MRYPPAQMSWKMVLEKLPAVEAEGLLAMAPDDLRQIVENDWRIVGRREQLPPLSPWLVWLYMAGRGAGKTRAGAEWVRSKVHHGYRRIHIVAPTAADARDTVVEGVSGILAISSDRDRPEYEITKRRLTWPNGAMATLFSAEEPERLRGPQCDAAWCDELAAWKYAQSTWDMLMFGMRLGDRPQVMISTTPKQIKLLRELVQRNKDSTSEQGPSVVITTGTTYDNLMNLAPTVREEVLSKYEGTTLGRQEIEGILLEDIDEALWTREMVHSNYVEKLPRFDRIVVAVDPPIASDEKAAEAGIIVCGLKDKTAYVIDDVSIRGKPETWAKRAISAYTTRHADLIVAEKNQGGEMVASTLRSVDPRANVKLVHAARGKIARAEPVSALYQQGRVKHARVFGELEDEMCTYVPGESESPNRLDALVWGIHELMIANTKKAGVWGRRRAA